MDSERIRALLRSFSGIEATASRAVIPALTLVSLGTVFREELQNSDQLILWLGITAQAMLAAAAVFYLGRIFLEGFQASLWLRSAVVAIYYFLIEAIRAIVIEVSAARLEPYREVNLPYAITAGGLTGVAFFGIASIILNDAREYKERFSEILNVRNRIANSIELSNSAIQTKRLELSNRISTAIEESMQKVLTLSKPSKDQAIGFAKELIQVSEEVVRPLSHQVYKGIEIPELKLQPAMARVRLSRVLELIPITAPFRAWPFVLLTVMLSLPAALLSSTKPINAFLSLVIIVVWFWSWFEILNRFLLPVLRKIAGILRWPLMLLGIFLMPVFPIVFFLVADERDLPSASGFVSYVLLLTIVIGVALATYPALEKARAELIAEAAVANQSLSWHVARLGSVLRIEEKNLARKLHKDIQGTLVASALRLQQTLEKKRNPKAAIEKIRKDVAEAVQQISQPESPLELKKYLRNLNAGWKPVFQIEPKISAGLLKQINNDPVCLASISDLLAEFATNSVKHGSSTKGTVEFELVSEDVVRLTFENNGKPLPENLKSGLGTQILMSMVITAAYETKNDGVRFTVDLAISPAKV